MHYVLGVDGGNSKTIALVAALDGTILGSGRGGCGDIYNAESPDEPDTAAAAIANIEHAVTSALRAAGVEAADLAVGIFNMAGADWPEDIALLRDAMQARGFGRAITVQNDALGVLHAALSGNVGVSVVCGSGGATGARAADGRTWHSSFWQDQAQGSFHLGQRTLDAVYRSALDIEPPTTLTPRILAFFHAQSVEEVLHLFTARVRSKHSDLHIDQLTPILLDEAQAGDLVARGVVLEHGRALGNYALAAARKVGIEGSAFALVLAGGVLRHPSPLLADTIIDTVRHRSPAVRPTRARFEPIIGVLLSALEEAGVLIDDAVMQRLVPTIPAPELFVTVRDRSG